MKRTPIKKIGKQGRKNLAANRKIAELWELHSINYCEARLEGCLGNWPLQNAHRHRRNYYYDKPELLSDFNQVIRACQNCHQLMDRRTSEAEQLTEELFNRLRD